MTHRTNLPGIAHWSWLVIGGLWGAWIGFGGFFDVSKNADSFASLLASGFFIAFALLGMLVGMAVSATVGWLVEHLMRRLGAGTTAALVIATLASLGAVWQVSERLLSRYPGLRTPVAHAVASAKALPKSTCASPPPSDALARKSWEAECR